MTIQKKIILTTTIVCFLCATVIGANILIISTRNLEKNINASNAVSAKYLLYSFGGGYLPPKVGHEQ
ncbi:hypothetical protein [Treponema phagedenis]|uniref:hypothetical protein n=1 Tax=Treponema phagedenis TaxID=162 RepID=UPI0015835F73|nr:hypothetical protein [Treponema phagedenis]QKS91264.1 hypothetical protein HPJ96_00805 [Treponema phagedenis]